ncbi:MAG: fused MFS/spermidine synthase [Bacteroidales bacterium]|nr:fused MFS/spermidine synthase [Bacteroidales bacterium]
MIYLLKIHEKPRLGLVIAVVILGISSIITQIIILREFLNIFYGNELVMGVILANWMLLTGLGAFIGKLWKYRGVKVFNILVFQVLIAFLPLLTVFLLNYLKNIVFTSGSMINMIEIFYASFVLLIPYCLASGLLFTFFSVIISRNENRNSISKVYSLDAIGSILGGLGFNFIILFVFSTFQSLKVILLINLVAAFVLANYTGYTRFKYIVLGIMIIAGVLVFRVDMDTLAKSFLFPGQEILVNKETPYGNIVITRSGDQNNFYEHGVPIFSSDNIMSKEEDVHYAMIQQESPQNILLISGGLSGTIAEILKYPVGLIDYVELNPWLINISKDYCNVPDTSTVNIIISDARIFVKSTEKKYDVIISNLAEPTTIQLNRYYTQEFFQELKRILNDGAVISVSLPSTLNYISEEEIKLNSILLSTLKSVFNNVLLIPGGKNYFLASDSILNINISKLINERNVATEYVNEYYIDDALVRDRSEEILSHLDNTAKVNRDFVPVSSFSHLQLWLSYFHINIWLIAVLLIFLLLLFLFTLNPVNLGMFTAGFTASSMEFLLIIAFQIMHGYIYKYTGVLITLFMAGLAAGAIIGQGVIRKINIKTYLINQAGIGLFVIIVPFLLIVLAKYNLHRVLTESVIILLAMIIGFLVGLQFNFASRLQKGEVKKVAASLYSADLFGSALGALIVAVFLLPLLGIIKLSLIIGSLNFLVILIIFVRRKIGTKI